MVLEMLMTVVKWISLPVLLTGSVFARFAGVYDAGVYAAWKPQPMET